MSEIRVNTIQPEITGSSLTFTGITTFSSTGSLTLPGGTLEQRPSSLVAGQIRVIQGELGNAVEYYNGTSWVQV